LASIAFYADAQQLDGFFQKSQAEERNPRSGISLKAVQFDRFKVSPERKTHQSTLIIAWGTPETWKLLQNTCPKVMREAGMNVKNSFPYDVYLPNDQVNLFFSISVLDI